jgi:hypothetical protein
MSPCMSEHQSTPAIIITCCVPLAGATVVQMLQDWCLSGLGRQQYVTLPPAMRKIGCQFGQLPLRRLPLTPSRSMSPSASADAGYLKHEQLLRLQVNFAMETCWCLCGIMRPDSCVGTGPKRGIEVLCSTHTASSEEATGVPGESSRFSENTPDARTS